MTFSQLLAKSRKGETLTEKEVNILAKKLGLIDSLPTLMIKILLTTIVIVGAIIGVVLVEDNIIRIIIGVVALLLLVLIYLIKSNTRRIVRYLETLKDFYIDRLCEYEGFESVLVQHTYMKNGYLQNSLAIFATDGYDFYIFDDLLKETEYLLPRKFKAKNNPRPALKIFNQEFVRKRPVCFKASDINFYQLLKPYVGSIKEKETYGYEYRRYTYTIKSDVMNNYCILELNDGSTFKLAPEVIMLLRKKATKKERD